MKSLSKNMDTQTAEQLYRFLKEQKLLTLATTDERGNPWTANLFYDVDESFTFYFVSSVEADHSKHLVQNSMVAFNVVWFDPSDHMNRKGVQGSGICRVAENEEIERGIKGHNERFPEFADRITVDWVTSNDNPAKVWVIESKRMKFWNDELFGVNGTQDWVSV